MFNSFDFINLILGNPYLRLAIISISLFCKLTLLAFSFRYFLKRGSNALLLSFLMLFLAGTLLEDIFYITSLTRFILGVDGFLPNFTLLGRIDWAFFITQYQAIALLCIVLLEKKFQFKVSYLPHILINMFISGAFLYLAIFKYHVPDNSPETLPYEIALVKAAYLYLPFLFIPLTYTVIKKMRRNNLPNILNHQLTYIVSILIPYVLLEIMNNSYSFLGFLIPRQHKYSFFSVTTVLCTIALVYIGKRVMGLRFLNLKQDVQSTEQFNFLSQFKEILEQLSYVTAFRELAYLSQSFFQAAFKVPLGRTKLYVRKITENDDQEDDLHELINNNSLDPFVKAEQFLANPDHKEILALLRSSKIFIRDEIAFTYFYEENPMHGQILKFLEDINADIFLPIYERSSMSAYIIVEHNARANTLYTNKERDEMLVFTSYLSNIINLVKYSNVESVHQRFKKANELLYHKHQENNQYRESIRSFMRTSKERKIGIIFYKNRRFTVANEAAQELVGMDLNTNVGHPLTQSLKDVAKRVREYRTAQNAHSKDQQGNKIVIAGIPALDEYATILVIYYPEIADLLQTQLRELKDPSAWDYVLYLETTQSGQLINQLIPGSSEKILNFKVNLLSTALSKKATLLTMPEDDLEHTVELLHGISLRQTLHVLKISTPEKNDEIAIKLFGMNPLMQQDSSGALLEKLDNIGTLYIQNVENLSLETQDALAQFISFGFFMKHKSDRKVMSSVRIICSSTKDLNALVEQGYFSRALFHELKEASLIMPPLSTFSEEEVSQIVQGFAEQIVTDDTYKNLLALTEKDKTKICIDRPLSLRELKEKVHQALLQKSSKHQIQEVTQFDPAYNIGDAEVAHAVRLGKKALKDPQIMAMLWNKFKNQNKIATLLGVNRSSVNRRCQEYNLK